MSGRTIVKFTKRGSIEFTSPKLNMGMLSFGISHLDYSYPAPNFVKIQGKLIIHGEHRHLFGPGGTLTVRPSGKLEIGDNFSIGHFSRFVISAHSTIGDNNMHSWQGLYMDSDSHPIFNNSGKRINPEKGFHIGNKVWFGARCTVLKGVHIADGCVVATNSLLTKSLCEANSIYASSRLIKSEITWESTIV